MAGTFEQFMVKASAILARLSNTVSDASAHIRVGVFELIPGTTRTVAVASVAAATTSAINTNNVMLRSDTDCFYVFASTPVATPSDILLKQDAPEKIGITPGHKVSVISVNAASTGTMYVTEMDTPA